MGWFLFGGKKEDELNKKIRSVEEKTRSSFNNVKDTFDNIKSWLTHLNEKDNQLDKKMEHILGKLDVLERAIYQKRPDYEEEPEERPQIKTIIKAKFSLENLTPTQRQMLGLIVRLIAERGIEWVYAKDIAEELYHDQPYEEVRSTMSEYLRYLEDEGLIKRRRRGKQIQVTVTDAIKDLKLVKKEVIKLKKKKNKI